MMNYNARENRKRDTAPADSTRVPVTNILDFPLNILAKCWPCGMVGLGLCVSKKMAERVHMLPKASFIISDIKEKMASDGKCTTADPVSVVEKCIPRMPNLRGVEIMMCGPYHCWSKKCTLCPADAERLGRCLPHKLRHLSLVRSRMGFQGARKLAPHIPRGLLYLNLDAGLLRVKGIVSLISPLSETLQYLILSKCYVFDHEATELGPHLPRGLLHLDLSGNYLWTGGVQGLNLNSLTGLLHLNLSFNLLNKEGAAELGPSLPEGLLHLDLSRNNLGSSGAKALVLPEGLLHLNLRDSFVSADAVQALRDKLPACTIIHESAAVP